MMALGLLGEIALEGYHGKATIVSAMRVVRPGQTFDVAVRITLDPGWHTYWQNPGDAGIPPKVTWRLPAGWTAGPLRWPLPHKLVAPEVVSYGYENEALLLTQIKAPKTSVSGKNVQLKAHVDWLVCREGCIPAKADVVLPMRIDSRQLPNLIWERRINAAVAALPGTAQSGTVEAWRSGESILLQVRTSDNAPERLDFFAADPIVDPSAPQSMTRKGGLISLTLKVSQFAPPALPRLRGLLISLRGASLTAEKIDIPIKRKN